MPWVPAAGPIVVAGGGSCTDPTISSTLGNVADQSGAYAPTLTHSGASVLTTATNTSTGSVTVTDSTTTTPSVPEPAAGSATLVTHTTTASDGLTHSISFVVAKAAEGQWSVVADVDFTTDITDLTLTTGAGDTTLYEADGTTAKATVGVYDRIATPSTSIGRITAADGTFHVECAGSNKAVDAYVRFDTSTLGIDFTDPSTVVMVSVLLSGQTSAQSGDAWASRVAPASTWASADLALGTQQYRSGSNYLRRGVQTVGGSPSVGTGADSQGSIRADLVNTVVIKGGRIGEMFSTPGSTVPTGIPTEGGTTLLSESGTATSIDTGPEFSADLYIVCEAFSGGGSSASLGIDRVVVQLLEMPSA